MNTSRVIAAVATFAVVVAGFGVAIAVFTAKKPPPSDQSRPTSTSAAPAPRMPTADEFVLGVVVTARDCPSADACVYRYRIDPKYVGLHPLPDKPIKVIYQVTGGQQPQTGDFTVQRGQASVLQNVPLEGPPGANLQASVTQILG